MISNLAKSIFGIRSYSTGDRLKDSEFSVSQRVFYGKDPCVAKKIVIVATHRISKQSKQLIDITYRIHRRTRSFSSLVGVTNKWH